MKKKRVINCAQCSVEVIALHSTRKFCSQKCADAHRYVPTNRKRYVVSCLNCGEVFGVPPSRRSAKYCSDKCCGLHKRRGITFSCSECAKEVYSNRYAYEIGKRRTCSKSCFNKRCTRLAEERNRVSPPSTGVLNRRIRYSKKMDDWRRAVFERDNYTCQECGARNGRGKAVILNADHIKPFAYYPELRFDLANGRTLCVECHRKTPTWGRNVIKLMEGADAS